MKRPGIISDIVSPLTIYINVMQNDNNSESVDKTKGDLKREQKEIKKIIKKYTQAISQLTKLTGKPISDIVQQSPSEKIVIFHFGTGSEDDFSVISETIKEKIGDNYYSRCFMDMFPGSAQCTVKFPCQNSAQKFYDSFPLFPYS